MDKLVDQDWFSLHAVEQTVLRQFRSVGAQMVKVKLKQMLDQDYLHKGLVLMQMCLHVFGDLNFKVVSNQLPPSRFGLFIYSDTSHPLKTYNKVCIRFKRMTTLVFQSTVKVTLRIAFLYIFATITGSFVFSDANLYLD